MSSAVLTISSKNTGLGAARLVDGQVCWARFHRARDPAGRPRNESEILLLSSSIRVPCLEHDGARVWDTLAIGEYLNEIRPEAALLPADRAVRAHCRAICGEMHSGSARCARRCR